MARIKSAWEIALEKTQDIEIDETKLKNDSLVKAGMALAGGYLNNSDQNLDVVAAKFNSYDDNERRLVRQGVITTLLSNISLPNDDIYQLRFQRTCDLAALASGSDAQIMNLMNQIGSFMDQYTQAKEAFVDRMQAQIQQAMENNPEGVNQAQYSQLISQNLKKMDAQYGDALENTKQQLKEMLG